MANSFSVDDLLNFLEHATERGLMPAATARALAVATRNVLGILTEDEKADLSAHDLDAVIKRFVNKRARDFSPASLKEYGRRVHRAVELYLEWREDPTNFTAKTRTTRTSRSKKSAAENEEVPGRESQMEATPTRLPGTYQSSLPVRPGLVVTVSNVPYDLTSAEAERLAGFIKMLAVQ